MGPVVEVSCSAAWGAVEELDEQLDQSLDLAMAQLAAAAKDLREGECQEPESSLQMTSAPEPAPSLTQGDNGIAAVNAHPGAVARDEEGGEGAGPSQPHVDDGAEGAQPRADAAGDSLVDSNDTLLEPNAVAEDADVPEGAAGAEPAVGISAQIGRGFAAALRACEQAYVWDLDSEPDQGLVADLGHLTARSFGESTRPRGGLESDLAMSAQEEELADTLLVEDLRTNSATKRKQPVPEDNVVRTALDYTCTVTSRCAHLLVIFTICDKRKD